MSILELINNIVYGTITNSVPIVLCVLGGIFAYKANVLNVGLEGMMLMGAFSSALFITFTGSIIIGILLGILATVILGFIFSYFAITLKSSFIITGLGINLLVIALSEFLLKFLGLPNINLTAVSGFEITKITIPFIDKIPILGPLLSGHTLITYITFALIIIISIVMYKTKFGTYVRVVGENEEAARSVGIKVDFIKYAAIIIGAVLCALAGAYLSVENIGLFTKNMTSGRGFIALAAIYCGQGRPLKTTMYGFIFGLTKSLAINLSVRAGEIAGLFEMIPYLMIVIVLAVVSAVEIKNKKTRGFKIEI